jgi:SAM-dependent methyltransferase
MTDLRSPFPAPSETFAWMGFKIPVDLIRLTGAGPESFEAISRWHIDQVDRAIGYTSNASVVEIGCGIGRDAIPLTQILGPSGSYVGIDIIKPSIDWCAHNITSRYPNFRFVHYDVADQLHNPGGKLGIPDCYIPAREGSVDTIIVFSVFTHMLELGIRFYLKEFRRVLKPGGRVFATCFIVDDAVLAEIRDKPVTVWQLAFRHDGGDRCYINDSDNPLGAVAYRQGKLHEMVLGSGLSLAQPIRHEGWQRGGGQDVMILKRPTFMERIFPGSDREWPSG